MVAPFEQKKFNAKFNLTTFISGDQMFALLTTTRVTFDVAVVDPEYLSKLYRAGRLSELRASAEAYAAIAGSRLPYCGWPAAASKGCTLLRTGPLRWSNCRLELRQRPRSLPNVGQATRPGQPMASSSGSPRQ
jgi:hypothetical protein